MLLHKHQPTNTRYSGLKSQDQSARAKPNRKCSGSQRTERLVAGIRGPEWSCFSICSISYFMSCVLRFRDDPVRHYLKLNRISLDTETTPIPRVLRTQLCGTRTISQRTQIYPAAVYRHHFVVILTRALRGIGLCLMVFRVLTTTSVRLFG